MARPIAGGVMAHPIEGGVTAHPDLIALSNLPWDSFFPDGAAPPLGAEARTHVGDADRVAPWLEPGARAVLEAESVGGSPTNAAITFAGLGGQARLIGPVALDPWGDRVRAALSDAGVALLEVLPPPTRQAHSLAFREPGGERRFLATLPEVPTSAELPVFDGSGPGWIVTSSYEFRNARFGALVREAFNRARAVGRNRALDLADPHAVRERRPEIRLLMDAGLELVLGSTDALAALLGSEVPPGAAPIAVSLSATRLRELAPIVIETRGAEGARLVTSTIDSTSPAPAVDVVDTTGAGDTLLGAVLFALARGDTPEAALELGQSAAAECLRRVGAHVPAERLRQLASVRS